ncbi:hypothetical protein RchiOBHm_Chr2g0087451 [Rosa chinensis]|uniref:Uncharacterized protein n=1 Tax=Rosa chinensis TaxID=74649 RepID=A0A2P6RIM9_ROSCH|nr:hypothetical protein RchiOBHm_Chr2g0087451 [Rosa chinensis]
MGGAFWFLSFVLLSGESVLRCTNLYIFFLFSFSLLFFFYGEFREIVFNSQYFIFVFVSFYPKAFSKYVEFVGDIDIDERKMFMHMDMVNGVGIRKMWAFDIEVGKSFSICTSGFRGDDG